MKKAQHVVPDPQGGWRVIKSGATRASKHFEKKVNAVGYARDLSAKQHAELIVHKKDGTISIKDSHGNDPCPPKDKDTHKK